MIETYSDVPAGIDAVRAVGTLSREDYESVVVPMLDAAAREGRGLRLLCVVDEDFRGLTPDGAWADVKLGLAAMRNLEGCAVVSDLAWVREATQVAGFFLPGHVRVFRASERDEAVRWLEDLPGRLATARIDPAAGVVIVDVGQPLRREDVEVIAGAVDGWLADHRELPGLVLHAPSFPGWENLGALAEHLRFVGGHQRRIGRVALAVDGQPVGIAARVAGTLLHPEVRHFASGELDEAIAWAGERARRDRPETSA
ncbi:MAG TPA: STAS/SEC14 domain-containing protein [Actinomycetospora sp.]|nr:STAS/SEC14 domain-containing protein [Actinomycetospora sp.]